jgi:hypothetical protein
MARQRGALRQDPARDLVYLLRLRIPRRLYPHQRAQSVRAALRRPHPQIPGGSVISRTAPELPIRDEAGRAHPRLQIEQHPHVPANELGTGDALYEADGAPV